MEKTLERLAKPAIPIRPTASSAFAAPTATPKGCASRLPLRVFAENDLEVTTEENQLVVRGRQTDDGTEYLHRGIAARQFQRCFVLADGMRVTSAELKNGLLAIDLDRPEPEKLVRKINISVKD